MRRLLVLLFLTTALHAGTYRDEKCGIEFELPDGWSANAVTPRSWLHHYVKQPVRCELGLRPRGWEKRAAESDGFLTDYAIHVDVFDEAFLTVSRISFFRDFDGQWRISSRGSEPPATDFKTACCQGVQGSGWSRAWNKKGEVGSLTYDAVVLNDRRRHSAYIHTEIGEEFEAELDRIVKTWRFIR